MLSLVSKESPKTDRKFHKRNFSASNIENFIQDVNAIDWDSLTLTNDTLYVHV